MSDPVLDWARSAGVALGDDWPADVAPLARLDPLLAGADLVFLGEMDHFIHEKSDFRLLCCRWLASHGWRSFAEELAWSDGRRVAGYLADGDEARFERLSLFGWRGDQRQDRDERPSGIFRASFNVYPSALMAAEQSRFYRGLRAAAGGRASAFHGFDIDGLSGGGYADIAQALAPRAAEPGVQAFLAALQRVPGESVADEAGRLQGLVQDATVLSEDVADDLRALAESVEYAGRTYGAPSYEAVAPGMAYREGCMKRRWSSLRRRTGNAPTVVMAHALHLAKDDGLLREVVGVGPGGGLECSIGHHLVQVLGLKAVSIWLLFGGGEDSQPMPDLPRRLAYPPDSLNARLAPLGRPWLVPVTGAPTGLFDAPIGVGHMYSAVQPIVLAGQVDAVVFLPRVSPMRSA